MGTKYNNKVFKAEIVFNNFAVQKKNNKLVHKLMIMITTLVKLTGCEGV